MAAKKKAPTKKPEKTYQVAKIDVRIVGISPLIMSAKPEDEILYGKVTGEAGGKPGKGKPVFGGEEDSPRAQAEKAIYWSSDKPDRKPVMPGDNLFKCITEGGKFHKLGANKVTTQKGSMVPGGIILAGDNFPIIPGDWEIYAKVVVNQSGNSVPSFRAIFWKWAIEFDLQIDLNLFSLNLVRRIVDDAGMKIGICSRRPECKGRYGQFRVDNWDISRPS